MIMPLPYRPAASPVLNPAPSPAECGANGGATGFRAAIFRQGDSRLSSGEGLKKMNFVRVLSNCRGPAGSTLAAIHYLRFFSEGIPSGQFSPKESLSRREAFGSGQFSFFKLPLSLSPSLSSSFLCALCALAVQLSSSLSSSFLCALCALAVQFSSSLFSFLRALSVLISAAHRHENHHSAAPSRSVYADFPERQTQPHTTGVPKR